VRARDIPGIGGLSTPEKILLVEDLWDEITAQEECVPVPESHKNELDRRRENLSADPGRLLSIDELCERVEKRI
jgi:putative addiction module component (TIGR02574 family)